MSLSENLKLSSSVSSPTKGMRGQETDWLAFCELQIWSGQLLIIDASLVPRETHGLLVEVTPGKYSVTAKVIHYGADKRISRLRACIDGDIVLGSQLGSVSTDTALIGICDYEEFTQVWGQDHVAANRKIRQILEDASDYGIVTLDGDGRAVMPFLSSGFGDGEFPVFGVVQGRARAGVEVEFVRPDEPYPL